MLTPREREALVWMVDLAEADTDEWDRDGGHVEGDAESIATRRVSIDIARAALARAPLAGPEVRAWRYVPLRADGEIESLPLDQTGEWDTPPDGYAVYVEGPPETPQLHLCDCATLEAARTIAELIALADAGEPIVGFAVAPAGAIALPGGAVNRAPVALSLPPVEHPAHTLSYKGSGVLVYSDAEGDIAIDVDGDDWRACLYAGRQWFVGEPDGVLRVRMEGTEADPGAPIEGEEAFTEEETPAGIMVHFPGGAGVLINRSHLFAYFDAEDGGSCTGALHRIADVEPDFCDAIGCPIREDGGAR